jgi:hypothetical protein
MKIPVGAVALVASILGAFLFLSGFGGLLLDYAPTVSSEAIAAARDRAQMSQLSGVVVMLLASGLAGHSARATPRLALSAGAVLSAACLFPLCFWLLA